MILRLIKKKTKSIQKCRRWAAEADSSREERSWLAQIPEVEHEQNLILGGLLALQLALRTDLSERIRKAMGWPPLPEELRTTEDTKRRPRRSQRRIAAP